jgi:hypothetical protein
MLALMNLSKMGTLNLLNIQTIFTNQKDGGSLSGAFLHQKNRKIREVCTSAKPCGR